MSGWVWVWLGALILLGWLPSLLISYLVALFISLGTDWPGAPVFWGIYAGLLAFAVSLLIQVQNFFELSGRPRQWLMWAGGSALILVWAGGIYVFRSLADLL